MTDKQLSDRERILTAVIRGLQSTALLCGRASVHNAADWANTHGMSYVHFVYYRKPIKGDLVIGETGRIDRWKIAFYESGDDNGNHVIRDLETGELCNYSNEGFRAIAGMSPIELLTGEKRVMYSKVMQAFARGDEYLYRPGQFEITDDTVTIGIRERHGGFGAESVPFSVTMKWNKRTTVKAILQAMRDGGYGTKSFRAAAAIGADGGSER